MIFLITWGVRNGWTNLNAWSFSMGLFLISLAAAVTLLPLSLMLTLRPRRRIRTRLAAIGTVSALVAALAAAQLAEDIYFFVLTW
ncbi:MAG: hypothetical protein RIB60_06915 [Phycisphaerales bacterium]